MKNYSLASFLELNVAVLKTGDGFFLDKFGFCVLALARSWREFLVFIMILLPLCCLGQFDLHGKINVDEGRIYLKQLSLDTSIAAKQYVCKIDQGNFSFQGELDEVNGYYFEFENTEGVLLKSDLFLLENGFQKAKVDLEFFQLPLVENELMKMYHDHTYFKEKKTLLKNILWLDSLEKSRLQAPVTLHDSLKNVYAAIRVNYLEREGELGYNLHNYFSDSYLSLWNIYLKYQNSYDTNRMLVFFNNLNIKIKESIPAKNLYNLLVNRDPTRVGNTFPFIRLYDLKNYTIQAINFHKKYTLIDFWWSGCGHCIKEFPVYLDLYRNKAGSIFDVVQISVDKTSALNQMNRIRERFGFPWREFLDENGASTSFLKLHSFPSNFLVDDQGIIIKKNIQPHELAQFLAKQNALD